MEYGIIQNFRLDAFKDAVNKAIANGWKLQGGVSMIVENGHTYYCQALVRTKPKAKK